jgi:hypothetical protein
MPAELTVLRNERRLRPSFCIGTPIDVWRLEWPLFFGGLDVRQVPSEQPFILIAKII